MTRDRALRKIMACLRLAGSANPNEAAAALRQARKLMAEYGLSEADALAADVVTADAPTRSRGAEPPRSVLFLGNVVAAGFKCVITVNLSKWDGRTVIRYYGKGADAQVAAYAFTVLRRQMDASRLAHTRRIRLRANKEKRGEEFAVGWVVAVRSLFPQAELDAEHEQALALAVSLACPNAESTAGREIGKNGKAKEGDRYAGYAAGKSAKYSPGLQGDKQRQLEHIR